MIQQIQFLTLFAFIKKQQQNKLSSKIILLNDYNDQIQFNTQTYKKLKLFHNLIQLFFQQNLFFIFILLQNFHNFLQQKQSWRPLRQVSQFRFMKSNHKLLLALSILLVTGFTWSLDMPLALEVPLRQAPYNFSNFDFSFLYFATYIAICFCDIPVGMLLDKLPLKKTILWITSILLVSQIGIMAMFHFKFNSYKTFLYLFRAFFGASGSALFTVQSVIITQYGGKYYDTLIGVGVCIPFFFDSLNNIVTPLIYNQTASMDLVWFIGILVCIIALISAITISKLVVKQQKQQNQKVQKRQKSQTVLNDNQKQEQNQELNFNGLKSMCKEFWIVIGAVLFTQLCIATYIDNLNDTLVKRFQIPYVTSGYFLFIPYGMAAFISFVLGRILERNAMIKRKIILIATSLFSAGMIVAYLLPNIESGNTTPTYYYIAIGIHFLTISLMMSILYGCLSSSIKYIVQQKHLGIAWGVIGSTVGLSEALGPVIAALVLQTQETLSQGYKNLALTTFLISIIAISFSMWIFFGAFQKIDYNSSSTCLVINQTSSSSLNNSLLDSQGLKNNGRSQQIVVNPQQVINNNNSNKT